MRFEDYVTEQGQALLRLAYVLTSDAHRAEDLTQTVLADAYRHWSRIVAARHPDARTVLALRYYADLDDVAIADATGISASAVRATAARTLASLRTGSVVAAMEETP